MDYVGMYLRKPVCQVEYFFIFIQNFHHTDIIQTFQLLKYWSSELVKSRFWKIKSDLMPPFLKLGHVFLMQKVFFELPPAQHLSILKGVSSLLTPRLEAPLTNYSRPPLPSLSYHPVVLFSLLHCY